MQTSTTRSSATPSFWKTPYGVVNVVADDNLITDSLRHQSDWAESELDLISGLLEEGATIVEFGSEYGIHALCLSHVAGDAGEVHVIEDDRFMHLQLCANVALNGIGNIHAHRAGRNGAVATLRDLNLATLQCIKVNTLGAVPGLLAEAKDLVVRHKPYLYFRLGSPRQAREEIAAVKALGYRCWSHIAYLHHESHAAGAVNSTFPGWAHQNVIAVPLESGVDADFAHLREI